MLQVQLQAYQVSSFARAYGISRSHVYKLWERGEGPIYYTVGSRRYIAVNSARAWQQAREIHAAA